MTIAIAKELVRRKGFSQPSLEIIYPSSWGWSTPGEPANSPRVYKTAVNGKVGSRPLPDLSHRGTSLYAQNAWFPLSCPQFCTIPKAFLRHLSRKMYLKHLLCMQGPSTEDRGMKMYLFFPSESSQPRHKADLQTNH